MSDPVAVPPGSLFGPALHFQHASSAYAACVCVGNKMSVFLARKTWLVFGDWQEKGEFVIFASPSTLQILIDSPKDFYNIVDLKGEHRARQDGCKSRIGIRPRSLGRAVLGDADLALLNGPSKFTFFCAMPHFLPVVFYFSDGELPRRTPMRSRVRFSLSRTVIGTAASEQGSEQVKAPVGDCMEPWYVFPHFLSCF